ncbi:alpha/beta hydrolase fold protein [Oscillochloris trichoides DG-6]|uniref:Alpha/beta hydrolase fold protein n=1 Tax=Oscillochloris trichoides DG-6 TaxID=765420 RepID=E1ICM1_9CHLR|nr:alpha/beta hydrolase [Oscillochloris trichoides]EFO81041.1 alpha/beta hydrolase fold protein [Oscillochloris trichoides DG-6]
MVEALSPTRTHHISEYWLEGLHGPMRYWHSEPRHGIPVILIHGYGGMLEHWRSVMRMIAREHTIIAPDLYFFGQSNIPHVKPSRELWPDQIAELIAETAHGPAILVGHSLGGMIAAQTAHDYPQLVRGLVLVNSIGLNVPKLIPLPDVDHIFRNVMQSPGVGEVFANLFGNIVGAKQGLFSTYHRKERITPELIEQFSAPLRRKGGREAYLTVSRAFHELHIAFEKNEVKVPSLLIWGDRDASVPVRMAHAFKKHLLPHAEIAIIPESGHCPFDETPQEFCDILLPWLERQSL